MTKEEFIRSVTAARETILLFLSNMPNNATVAEVVQAIHAEALSDAGLDRAYSQLMVSDISATQSIH